MPAFPRVKPGDPITADMFNLVAASLENFSKLDVVQGCGLLLDSSPNGKVLGIAGKMRIRALLSGATSPYSWQEVEDTASGATATFGNRAESTNAYEINAVAGLAGTVQELWWTAAGDWRFQAVRYGCLWTFTVRRCGTLTSGADVNLSQGGGTLYTGTTNGSGVVTINAPADTYDIEVISPDGDYDDYTATGVVHTCPQSTAIALPPLSGTICPDTLCFCKPMPSPIFITGIDPDGNPVADTMVWNSPPVGYPGTPPSNRWFGQSLHTRTVGASYYLTLACSATNIGLSHINATLGTATSIWTWNNGDGANTCHPFSFPVSHAVGAPFGGSWAISA